MIIDTDFNLNVLLQLFFSLSKKFIFFLLISDNNNLLLKIYCENNVIIDTDFNLNVLLKLLFFLFKKLFFSYQYYLIITYHLKFIMKIL